MKFNLNKILEKKWILILIIIILGVVCYSNIFKNEFVVDDNFFIKEYKLTHNLKNIPTFFKLDVDKVYRPIRTTWYAIMYKLSGENPVGYHIYSLLIHILVSIFVFLCLQKIMKKNVLAFFGALLFVTHPIQTESVTFITSSFDILGIFFLFVSFYIYLVFLEKKLKFKPNKTNELLFLSLIFYLLALFTYEIVLVFPVILFIHYFCFVKEWNKKHLIDYIKNLKIWLPYLVCAGFYLFVRFGLIKIIARREDYIVNGSFYLTQLTMMKSWLLYLKMLILPTNLSLFHAINFAKTILDVKIILSIIVIIALVVFSFKIYKKSKTVSFCIWWFFIALLPVANIVAIQTLIQERYLYLASFSFVLLLGFILYKLFSIKKYRALAIIVFILIILLYCIGTHARNKDWKNEQTIWRANVEAEPNSFIQHYSLGKTYENQGNYVAALDEYKKAYFLYLKNQPAGSKFARLKFDVANVLLKLGEYNLSKEIYLELVSENPKSTKAHYNLAVCYEKLNEKAKAAELYKKVIELDSTFFKAYNNLGVLLLKNRQYNESIIVLNEAIKINPKFAEAYYNLGLIYSATNNFEQAIEYFEKTIELNPGNTEARYNLLVIYIKLDDVDRVNRYVNEILEIEPENEKVKKLVEKVKLMVTS